MRKLLMIGIVFLMLTATAYAQEFMFGEETKGLKVKISDDTDITTRIRLQPRFDMGDMATGEDKKSYESETDIYIRRIRLEFGGQLLQDLKYSLIFEADKNGKFASSSGSPTNEVKIQYANIDYKFDDLFNLRFGKAKLPYSRISLTSSSKQLIVERPNSTEATKKLFDDYYQSHIVLHGKASEGIFAYNFAIGDGWEPNSTIHSGITTTSYDTKCETLTSCTTTSTTTDTTVKVHKSGTLYIARVEISPPGWIEKSQSDAHLGNGKHLTIGADYAAQQGIEYKGNNYEEDRTLTGFDISGHWNAITGQLEYNTWKEEYTDPSKSDKEPNGWYVQAGYFVQGPNIEPVVRYEIFDQDSNSDDKEEKTTTLGVNWYGKGHSFKVGMNWAHTEYDKNASGYLSDDDKKDVYQVQAQLYF